jgi:hypothetical protein
MFCNQFLYFIKEGLRVTLNETLNYLECTAVTNERAFKYSTSRRVYENNARTLNEFCLHFMRAEVINAVLLLGRCNALKNFVSAHVLLSIHQ